MDIETDLRRYLEAQERGHVETQLNYLEIMVEKVLAYSRADGTEMTRGEALDFIRDAVEDEARYDDDELNSF